MLSQFKFCLLFILLLSVFGTGLAAAADDFDPDKNSLNSILSGNLHILDYQETIYVNGETVTIVNNFESVRDGNMVRTYNGATYSANSGIFNVLAVNVIQFNLSDITLNDDGQFVIYLCGSFNETDTNVTHLDRELTFKVESKEVEKLNTEDPENADPDVKKIVYPVTGGFTHDFNKKPYYIIDFSTYFNDGSSVYPDFKETVLYENNMIYSFEQGCLRMIYWYETEDENEELEDGDAKTDFIPYEPEFIMNLSSQNSFSLNHVFICPVHDSYIGYDSDSRTEKVNVAGTLLSECSETYQWNILINDDEKDGLNYLCTYQDSHTDENLNDDFEELPDVNDENAALYPHFMSLNSDALRSDLLKNRNLAVTFYPYKVIQTDDNTPDENADPNEIGNEDEKENVVSYHDAAYSFTFKREFRKISFNPVIEDGKISISVKNDLSSPEVSGLSGISFPGSEALLEVLQNSELIVENLNSEVLKSIENEYLGDETPVHAVVNIDFSNKDEINAILSETEGRVLLEFEVPMIDSEGNVIERDELNIFHIVEENGETKLVPLKIESVSRMDDYYIVTAGTPSFSSFAVASLEPEAKTSRSGSNSFGFAAEIPVNEPETKQNDTPEPYSIDIPQNPVTDIIQKVQGHLSVFSILVVLTSGLFMWDYIRRRI
ncbi:hypothetical protein MmiAt1_05340 [Methanimicrococcus sp. At1]|uniref:Uncharacterized protein n=1 Tax=Methanimicrococcus hacksteinii TaxID=3028293 RepID=A0ABU3VNL5_9EURY|nr:hypothetical protein [Methanimicrococcus sp. At1]MDV0444982.1 hypothetical protein [Methanimicrococcus sp. At1]